MEIVKKGINTHIHWYIALLLLDVLMLFLHLLVGTQNSFFHLDFESNLPTFYQSGKLIFFGSFILIGGFSKKITWKIKSFVLPLSFFLIFLGLDELLQIHENMYRIFELFDWLHPSKIVDSSIKMGYRSSLWIIYYLPFITAFIFWCGYWLSYFQSNMKEYARLILISSLNISIVLLCEVLSSTGTYSESTYFGLVTLEELAEMLLASTFILTGLKMLHTYKTKSHRS